MGREIKIRIWHNERFHYFTVQELLNTPQTLQVLAGEPADEYTGLRDKNGVEIYEGDIVRWFWPWQAHHGLKGTIEVVSLKLRKIDTGEDYEKIMGWNEELESSEVIGNIYQNPELLESTENAQ